MPAAHDGGLGHHLVGDKINVNQRSVSVTKLLGEGGFSYVYLVREISDGSEKSVHNRGDRGDHSTHGESTASSSKESRIKDGSERSGRRSSGTGSASDRPLMVLKVTSIHSRQQRDIAEKEAKLLSRLSHPSIIKMFDTCYCNVAHTSVTKFLGGGKVGGDGAGSSGSGKERPQHLILMEYCEGGHALDVCSKLAASGQRFDLSTLIIAFGQICNAVSYLHAQRPPIVHRDLKPVNFLVRNGAYKLCDFGSAVFGHVDLRTPRARAEAEEIIQKTTTQMFRAPEMVDLYMAKKLTQATDVWALGCCLFSLAFLQNCFEEGSNLAILSRKYKIPEDNPYGEGIVELLDRMLTIDSKQRADMTEVILCLSAVYSGRPLPERKKPSKPKKSAHDDGSKRERKHERVGTYRTDGQGIHGQDDDMKKPPEAKKLNPNSAAARRRRAAQTQEREIAGSNSADVDFSSFHSRFDDAAKAEKEAEINEELAFSTVDNPFADVRGDTPRQSYRPKKDSDLYFGSFEENNDFQANDKHAFAAFDNTQDGWGKGGENGGGTPDFASFSPDHPHRDMVADVMQDGSIEIGLDSSLPRRSYVGQSHSSDQEQLEQHHDGDTDGASPDLKHAASDSPSKRSSGSTDNNPRRRDPARTPSDKKPSSSKSAAAGGTSKMSSSGRPRRKKMRDHPSASSRPIRSHNSEEDYNEQESEALGDTAHTAPVGAATAAAAATGAGGNNAKLRESHSEHGPSPDSDGYRHRSNIDSHSERRHHTERDHPRGGDFHTERAPDGGGRGRDSGDFQNQDRRQRSSEAKRRQKQSNEDAIKNRRSLRNIFSSSAVKQT